MATMRISSKSYDRQGNPITENTVLECEVSTTKNEPDSKVLCFRATARNTNVYLILTDDQLSDLYITIAKMRER